MSQHLVPFVPPGALTFLEACPVACMHFPLAFDFFEAVLGFARVPFFVTQNTVDLALLSVFPFLQLRLFAGASVSESFPSGLFGSFRQRFTFAPFMLPRFQARRVLLSLEDYHIFVLLHLCRGVPRTRSCWPSSEPSFLLRVEGHSRFFDPLSWYMREIWIFGFSVTDQHFLDCLIFLRCYSFAFQLLLFLWRLLFWAEVVAYFRFPSTRSF